MERDAQSRERGQESQQAEERTSEASPAGRPRSLEGRWQCRWPAQAEAALAELPRGS